MKWTYRYLDPFRYIVTDNEKLVFGCPTKEEARHLANHLNRMDKERDEWEERYLQAMEQHGFTREFLGG